MKRRAITSPLPAPLLDFLYPPLCLACEREERPGPLRLGLCLRCRGRLRPLGGPRCAGCGARLAAASAVTLCGACRRRPPVYTRLHAVWSYQPPLEQVVHALKFGRLDFLGRHLAEEIWHRLGGSLRGAAVVTPVPLHWRRQMARGYNQAERIARPLARRLGRPLIHGLRRVRATAPQARLGSARRPANLRGAFRARGGGAAIRGRRVLLVDDVTTTGETLRQAAAALAESGAGAVIALAVARTPPPGRKPFDSGRATI